MQYFRQVVYLVKVCPVLWLWLTYTKEYCLFVLIWNSNVTMSPVCRFAKAGNPVWNICLRPRTRLMKLLQSEYPLLFSTLQSDLWWDHSVQFSSVQSLSRVRLSVTPWTAAHQACLSITNSRSPPRLTSIESVMPSSHLSLCRPLLLLPPIPPSLRVFSSESALCIRQPEYWREMSH